MTHVNTPISFTFHETQDVRIQTIKGEPCFCLKDVCDLLEIKITSQLSLQVDEAGICKTYIRSGGQNRQLTFVNEPNL